MDSNQNLTNNTPTLLKKKHNSDSNEKQQQQPHQQSSSTKTSPLKVFNPKENLRRISQAKSIDIECVATDDEDELNGILVAQRTNNYLSFDSEMLKNRPNSLRLNEADYLANHYETTRLINPHHHHHHHHAHATALETKYLSNPILSNEKKKLNFRQSKTEFNARQEPFHQQTNFSDANNINNNTKLENNKLPVEKASLSSNNSVFFRSKNELSSDQQSIFIL